MLAIMREGSGLISVVVARDGQYRDGNASVVLRVRVMVVPVFVLVWMRNPLLENGRRIPQESIQLAKRTARFKKLAISGAPETLTVEKQPLLRGASRHQGEPLHE